MYQVIYRKTEYKPIFVHFSDEDLNVCKTEARKFKKYHPTYQIIIIDTETGDEFIEECDW